MRKRSVSLLLLVLVMLCGCTASTKEEPEENGWKLYYLCTESEDYREKSILCSETHAFEKETVDVKSLLTVYLNGPYTEDALAVLPENVTLLDFSADGGRLTLYFNAEFMGMSGMERTLACAALTYTMTQLDEIEFVEIYVRRSSGDLMEGIFSPDDFLLYDASTENPMVSVKLYFTDNAGKLTETDTQVSCISTEQLPQIVMEELLAGADLSYHSCIPQNAELLEISVSEELATVVLSEEFVRCDTSNQRAGTAVNQIVKTLCALDGIRMVQIEIAGNRTLSHVDISQPLSP